MHPFSLEKNYGKELNETMSIIPEGDWCAIMDWDCMLLSSAQVGRMYGYVNKFSDAGMFVCNSNRCGSMAQRYKYNLDMIGDVKKEHLLSEEILFGEKLLDAKPVSEKISGFLMLISKRTWNEIKFNESLKVLDVDRDYAKRILDAGKQILLMESVYVWHSYRIWKDIKDVTHLI